MPTVLSSGPYQVYSHEDKLLEAWNEHFGNATPDQRANWETAAQAMGSTGPISTST